MNRRNTGIVIEPHKSLINLHVPLFKWISWEEICHRLWLIFVVFLVFCFGVCLFCLGVVVVVVVFGVLFPHKVTAEKVWL